MDYLNLARPGGQSAATLDSEESDAIRLHDNPIESADGYVGLPLRAFHQASNP